MELSCWWSERVGVVCAHHAQAPQGQGQGEGEGDWQHGSASSLNSPFGMQHMGEEVPTFFMANDTVGLAEWHLKHVGNRNRPQHPQSGREGGGGSEHILRSRVDSTRKVCLPTGLLPCHVCGRDINKV